MTEMKFTKVAELGAGVMGAQIAVHLINARVLVVLFDLAEASGNKKLVIWMPDGLFAAGFSLKMLLDLCVKEEPQAVEIGLPALQQLSFRLRYALGSHCEITLYCTHRAPALKCQMGLVEFKRGVTSAGGGLAYQAQRAAENTRIAYRGQMLDALRLLPGIAASFSQVIAAATKGSVFEAKKMRYASSDDMVVSNKDELPCVAIQQAKTMAASVYRALPMRPSTAGDAALKKSLQALLEEGRNAGKYSEYEMVIDLALAGVLSCASVAGDTWVSKAFLLDMECVAFIALLAETRTQELIEGMVKTGQPVRT